MTWREMTWSERGHRFEPRRTVLVEVGCVATVVLWGWLVATAAGATDDAIRVLHTAAVMMMLPAAGLMFLWARTSAYTPRWARARVDRDADGLRITNVAAATAVPAALLVVSLLGLVVLWVRGDPLMPGDVQTLPRHIGIICVIGVPFFALACLARTSVVVRRGMVITQQWNPIRTVTVEVTGLTAITVDGDLRRGQTFHGSVDGTVRYRNGFTRPIGTLRPARLPLAVFNNPYEHLDPEELGAVTGAPVAIR